MSLSLSSPYKVDVPLIDLASFCGERFKSNLSHLASIDMETGVSLTYQELIAKSENLIKSFLNLGIKQKDFIAVILPNCIEYQIIVMACLSLGVGLVLINHLSTTGELIHYFDLISCTLIITSDKLVSKVEKAIEGQHNSTIRKIIVKNHFQNLISFEECITNPQKVHCLGTIFERKKVTIDPLNDIAVILFSSGTTGLPKPVMLTHHNYISAICQYSHPVNECIEESQYSVLYQPASHGYGFFRLLFCLTMCKTTLFMAKFNLYSFLQAIETYKIKTIHLVPPIAVMICSSEISSYYDLNSLKIIYSSAAPMGEEMENKLKSYFKKNNLKIVQAYGLTECTGIVTQIPGFDSNHNDVPPGSVGLLYANTVAKVVHPETNETLGPYEEGEILVKGAQVMLGYLSNTSATKEMITDDGFVHTGDLGYYDVNGFFFVKDRLKELIKHKGLQVAPAELESILMGNDCIADVAVVGIPDKLMGECPQAWIVKKKNSSCSEIEIVQWLSERVSSYKNLTGGVKFVNEIPKSANGKILRKELKKLSGASKL